MSVLAEVQHGLEKAHSHSTRGGKWSTVSNVKRYEGKADLTTLRKLVKEGAATEKVQSGVPLKLFKPTRAGTTALSADQELGLETPRRGGEPKKPGRRDPKRPTGRRKPRRGKKPGRRPDKPNRRRKPTKPREPTKPSGPRRGGNVGSTVGAGIATMLVGGLGGSTTPSGGTTFYTVPR